MAYEMTFQRSQKGSGIYPYNREVVIDYDRLAVPKAAQAAAPQLDPPSPPLSPIQAPANAGAPAMSPSRTPPTGAAEAGPPAVQSASAPPVSVPPVPTALPVPHGAPASPKIRHELSVGAREDIPTPILWFFLILRFFNLLEPGRYVISISKSWMWIMLATSIYVFVYTPENAAAVIGAAAGAAGSMGNYAWRRYMQHVTGSVIRPESRSERDKSKKPDEPAADGDKT